MTQFEMKIDLNVSDILILLGAKFEIFELH